MTREDYWKECISVAADECGLAMTVEQIAHFADTVAGAHETYGMAFGDAVASANLSARSKRENADLTKALNHEREKEVCDICCGRGRIISTTGVWATNTGCHTCNGEGKVHPSKKYR